MLEGAEHVCFLFIKTIFLHVCNMYASNRKVKHHIFIYIVYKMWFNLGIITFDTFILKIVFKI